MYVYSGLYVSAMIYSLHVSLSLALCIWLNNFHGQLPTVRHKLPQITAERQPNPYNEIKIHSQIKRRKEGGERGGSKERRQSQNEEQQQQQQQEQH